MAQKKIVRSVAIIAMLSLAACGSSGSGTSSSSTPTDATKSVNTVSVDVSNIDASQQSSAGANISVGKSVTTAKRIGSDINDASGAGCNLNSIKQEGIRVGREIDGILCYLGTAQDQLPTTFIIDAIQRYYSVTVSAMKGESSQANFTFLMRIQKSGGTLTMDMCEGATPVLTEEFSVTQTGQDISANGYHYFKGESGKMGSGFEDKGAFDLILNLKSSATGSVDYTDVNSGSVLARFNGSYGRGQMTFAKTSGMDLNDISGVFLGQFGPSNDNFTA